MTKITWREKPKKH